MLDADGRLDRKRLASHRVRRSRRRRKRLEAITHPAIRDAFAARAGRPGGAGFEGLVVWDAPVMIESGGHKDMDRLVVVITDAATQHARAVARDGDRADVERGSPARCRWPRRPSSPTT